MQKINGKTQVFGIMGDPVTHSLSPLFQNYFLQAQKINAVYLPFHVTPENIEDAIGGLHASGVQGLNVTIPHKESILPFVNADKDATDIGAVNTIKRQAKAWAATNTDWIGFSDVISGLQANVQSSPVLLFGAGGTSKAILHALNAQATKEVFLCNRNLERAQTLAHHLKQVYPNMHINVLPWDNHAVKEASKICQLIINSTSIGLNHSDIFPFELIGSGFAIDAVYKPHGNTVFCKAASNYQAIDGLPMLIAQGIASLSFWLSETQANARNLPNKQASLQWVETQLGRDAISLPGWRA